MKQKNKLLHLKKETLIALQEKQLRAIRGGQEQISITSCLPTEYCYPQTDPSPAPQSCCKKTCNGEELPTPDF